jgi:hypothetical protein
MNLDSKTNEELIALRTEIENNPANRNPPGTSLFLYTRAAVRKIDRINQQITHNLAMRRAAEGNPVPTAGYSGRKCNKRR